MKDDDDHDMKHGDGDDGEGRRWGTMATTIAMTTMKHYDGDEENDGDTIGSHFLQGKL